MVRGVGFEPTNLCRIGASGGFAPTNALRCELNQRTATTTEIDYEDFKRWVYANYRPFTARPVVAYSRTYGHLLLSRNLNMLHTFSDGKRTSIIKALCTLSKYLGMHSEFTAMIKNFGLKWAGRSDDDIIIDRLSKNTDIKPLIEWVREGRKIAEMTHFLDLIVATGLRMIEAVECVRLIVTLSKQGKLGTYYDSEREIFEHFRFKETFIRNSKKVFISFVPRRIVEAIATEEQPITYDRAQHLAENRLRKLRFADLRELYASVSVKNLRESEIDFLQGRISSRVFLRNYFNPHFINDLQVRALKNAEELLALCL
ncbi:MAG: hypothetical protein ACE14S_07900 [Candidatus Bathyarchaeia archaeon]